MKKFTTATRTAARGASIRPSTFTDWDDPGPLADYELLGAREDRLKVTLPLSLRLALQAVASAEGIYLTRVAAWEIDTGLLRLRGLPDVRLIERAKAILVGTGSTSDNDALLDWPLDLWPREKRRPLTLRGVSGATYGRRSELEETLGCDSISAVALTLGLVGNPHVPDARRVQVEATAEAFLQSLHSRRLVLERVAETAAVWAASRPTTPPASWRELVGRVDAGGGVQVSTRHGRRGRVS